MQSIFHLLINCINNNNLYILGNGGYALAVKAAALKLNMKPIPITRNNWDNINKKLIDLLNEN